MTKPLMALLFVLIITFAIGCSGIQSIDSLNASSEIKPQVAGGDNAWCKHEEKEWIHIIPGSFIAYVGSKAYDEYAKPDEYSKLTDEEKEARTVIAMLKHFNLSYSEVGSLIDKEIEYSETYNQSVKEQILKELFGDVKTDIIPVCTTYKYTEGDSSQGLLYGGASYSSIGTEENRIPYSFVSYVGIRQYNLWFESMKNVEDEYTLQKFLTYFEITAETYDLFMGQIARNKPNGIYNQKIMDKIRNEAYGSTKEYQWGSESYSASSTAG